MWKKIKDLFKSMSPSTHFIKGTGSVMDLAPNKNYSAYEKFKENESKIQETWKSINECNKCKRNSLSDYSGIKRWDHEENIEEFLYPKENKNN